MRHDDMIATMLAWEVADAPTRASLWLQLVDRLARAEPWGEDAAAAVDRLRALTGQVAVEVRRATADRLAGAALPPALVALFAEDADVTRPLLATVRLDAEAWEALLPGLPTTARAILAARHDLPPPVARLLGDRAPERSAVLPVAPVTGAASPPAADADADPVKQLIARIAAFQAGGTPEAPSAEPGFGFAIDADGAIVADGHGPLDARLGEAPSGVDGQALGPWRAGEAFADARLLVADGPLAGEWLMAATPLPRDGDARATFRGTARRPRAHETARPLTPSSPRAARPALAQAIDALRLPLAGLSVIDDAAASSPAAAGDVVQRGLALAEAIEQFDLAQIAGAADERIDLATVVARLNAVLAPLAEARGVALNFRIARDLPVIDADPQAVERMVSRLVGTALGLARTGERLVARIGLDREDGGRVALMLTRPGRLVGRSPQALRHLGDTTEGADAPLLAFGFALRLVERLAADAGGTLAIHDDRFRLALPHRNTAADRRKG